MIDSKINKISDICGGKVNDDFSNALREVVANMNEPKCSPDAVRKITLEVTFKKDPRNGLVDVGLDTSIKLAKQAGRRSMAYFGKGNDGQMGLFMDDPDQATMFHDLENQMSQKPREEVNNG